MREFDVFVGIILISSLYYFEFILECQNKHISYFTPSWEEYDKYSNHLATNEHHIHSGLRNEQQNKQYDRHYSSHK